jgi:hypothetical protein
MKKADKGIPVGVRGLLDLVVSAERRDWITKRYPPTDQGRPGILVVNDGRSKREEADMEPREIVGDEEPVEEEFAE